MKHESLFQREFEDDESYFGGKRTKRKKGRGSFRTKPILGMLQRNGKVGTEIFPDCSKGSLQAIIRGKADLESVINSDGWRGYNGMIDLGYKKYFRVLHKNDELSREKNTLMGLNATGH